MSSILGSALLCVFPLMMIYAALSDLFTMTISNHVSLILMGAFLIIAPFSGLGLELILIHIATAFGVLVIGMGLFAAGWIGGGDVKLAASSVLWLGLGLLADYLIYAALLGGAFALLVLIFRAQPMIPLLYRYEWATKLHSGTKNIPYGVALGLAALILYPETDWIKTLLIA